MLVHLQGWTKGTTFQIISSFKILNIFQHYVRLYSPFTENNDSFNFYNNPNGFYDIIPAKIFDERLWSSNVYTVINSETFFQVSSTQFRLHI